MTALKFISEIIAPGSRVVITNTHQPLSAAVLRQLLTIKHLTLLPTVDPNQEILPDAKPYLVLHFAGFDKPSLAQTLHLTSTLHKLMDYGLTAKAKFILVIPDVETPQTQTAFSLVKQFGKNFGLDYLIITVSSEDAREETAATIIRTFIKGFQLQEVPPELPVSVSRPRWGYLFILPGVYAAWWLLWGACLWGGLHELTAGRLVRAASLAQTAEKLTPWGGGTLPRRLAETEKLVAEFGQQPLTPPPPRLAELLAEVETLGVPLDVGWLRQIIGKLEILQPDIANFLAMPQLTWLVLLQDTQQIRATGGYLTSFGIVTFKQGRVTKVQLYETSSTDELLRGQVDPPADLAQATGQSNWWMRDSNWDPDYPTTAARTAWFVKKELGVEVDGVVSVNTSLLEAVEKIVGPGDTKDILAKLGDLPVDRKALIWRIVGEQLSARQLALVWLTSANQLQQVGWDGSLYRSTCTDCLQDLVYVVDSNVGDNKISRAIRPVYGLTIKPIGEAVNYDYRLSYTNLAGAGDIYHNYVRLLISPQQTVDQLILNDVPLPISSYRITQASNLIQVGTLIEVPVGSSSTLVVKTHRLASDLPYELEWLNQPGQNPIPLTIATAGQLQYNGSLSAPLRLRGSLYK